VIERYDHYTKQTYRNRCNLYGANGLLTLSIPVHKQHGHKTFTRDIRIDDSRKWQKLHWKGIESAYMHSPFFEFYMDEIRDFLVKRHTFLIDLNTEILEYLLESLEIGGGYTLSGEYLEMGNEEVKDLRDSIHPKRSAAEDPEFLAKPYSQVFIDRYGFLENLSILDLLFNEGPNARDVLEACTLKT
jgi:hypothetical protein